ncbi:hypothetical protein [Desulfotomaculum copahuensis]|uniref:hypothetical protein n=1 Tax=Desulfotomaculum copahuensis TaxID=1838280 RepID=UPI000AF32591|nr:hypothetical protein [Desulfotomaculum copahuensis]
MAYLSYNFSGLQSWIYTKNSFAVSTTENVSVVLVQYATGCVLGNCAVDLTYSLVKSSLNCAECDCPDYGPIEVNGEYNSQSNTIVFHNVSPGTYRLCIYNKNYDTPADGNGYIYY